MLKDEVAKHRRLKCVPAPLRLETPSLQMLILHLILVGMLADLRQIAHGERDKNSRPLRHMVPGGTSVWGWCRKPLNRRFIVVEAVYKALGDLAPLAAIARLKHKYKFRLVVDESLAFGVLGASGRGACEHFGLQREDVEIICASMGQFLCLWPPPDLGAVHTLSWLAATAR